MPTHIRAISFLHCLKQCGNLLSTKEIQMKATKFDKDLDIISNALSFYFEEGGKGDKREQHAVGHSWARIRSLARAGDMQSSCPSPHLLATLLDGMAGMIQVGVDKGAINKASAKSMIALAKKASRNIANKTIAKRVNQSADKELIAACRCPELDRAHDKLSALLEDCTAENDDIRCAAVDICDELVSHYEKRRKAIAKANTKA